jgi:Papain family cysteine protease
MLLWRLLLALQMLVDCSYSNKDGCYGGWPTAAWDYVIANKGLAPEAVKPYARFGREV